MANNWKKQASVAYGCALTRMALNLYLYFESFPQSDERKEEKLSQKYMELLGLFLDGKQETVLEIIGDFHSKVREHMRRTMVYADAFQIYEYALNRVERRFVKLQPMDMAKEALVGNLMGYIASSRDAAIQNQRIQQIVGQLPIRLTRQKYFGMIHDALTSYIGADMAALEDIMFLLRSGSMTELFSEHCVPGGRIGELLSDLEKLSFKELDGESFKKAWKQIGEGCQLLEDLSQHNVYLQEMVNDLYILCLTERDAVKSAGEQEAAWKLLRGLWRQSEEANPEIPSELSRLLPRLEGIQEEYYEKYERLDVSQDITGEDGTLTPSGIVDRLMSTSTFASLDAAGERKEAELKDVEEAADRFFADLGPVFASCQKPVVRAIMATTLSCLPVFFNSPDEICNYIKNSLGSCSDWAEKEASIDLLLQLMESDGYDLV